jgi:hypothetical protein
MKGMNEMKDYKFDFEVEGIKYNLVFNLNVMEAIQEEYGTIEKWGSLTDGKGGEVNAKALIFGLTEMINEGIDIENDNLTEKRPLLTRKQVGRIVTKMGLENTATQLNDAIVESTKSEEKNA